MNKVRTVEKPTPQTMAVATGRHSTVAGSLLIASGNKPTRVVNEVIKIGNIRRFAAYTVAWTTPMPSARRSCPAENIKIAEFTAIPANATAPYKVLGLIGSREMNSPKIKPAKAIGTFSNTKNGMTKLRNWAPTIRKIRPMPKINFCHSRLKFLRSSSALPAVFSLTFGCRSAI